MTISSTDNRITFAGNDVTTAFATGFKFFASSDLSVILVTDSTGVETGQVLNTDYTVTGAGADAGGTVTMVTAPATGETLVIVRAQPYTQGLDLVENDPFPSDSVEQQLDKLTILTQQNNSGQGRSLRQPDGDTANIDTLPPKVTRATKVLAFDSDGDPVASTSTLDDIESGATDAAASAAAASSSASAASTSASNASASATLASEWATKTDGQVASTDYSSKAWAIGGTGVTDTASAGAAKEWATAAEDDLVDGSEYSAKHYSAKASAQATAAANSAASAAASAQGFSGVTLLTASSNDVETTDARTYYQVDASSNTVAINLPSIGTGNDGLSYTVEVLDVSNAITLVRDGSDTINGVSGNYTGLVEAGQVIQIIADDGTPDNWIVVQTSALKVDDTTVELSGRTIQVKDNGITPAKVAGSIQDQSGTTYTLVLGDAFKTVSLDNASAVAVTVPLNSSVAFSTSDRVDFINEGAGQVTVSGASGVTINDTDAGSFTIDQYGGATIIKVGTDAWIAPNQTVA